MTHQRCVLYSCLKGSREDSSLTRVSSCMLHSTVQKQMTLRSLTSLSFVSYCVYTLGFDGDGAFVVSNCCCAKTLQHWKDNYSRGEYLNDKRKTKLRAFTARQRYVLYCAERTYGASPFCSQAELKHLDNIRSVSYCWNVLVTLFIDLAYVCHFPIL